PLTTLATVAFAFTVFCVDQHIFMAVRGDPRATNDIAIAVANGDDLDAIWPRDSLASPATRQLFVVDLRRVASDAVAIITLHDRLAAKLQDDAVADLAKDISAFAAFPAFASTLDPAAFFCTQRLD